MKRDSRVIDKRSGASILKTGLVSVLVPARNEEGNISLFLEEAQKAFDADGGNFEVVVIDDGSTDGTWNILLSLIDKYDFLKIVRHRTGMGIAEALRTGWLYSTGSVLVFYPADLQFKPEDIPRLAAPVLDGSFDMVTGFKQGKYEKAFVSKIYNGLSRKLFRLPVRDLNNVKAYRREIMDALPMRQDWHRYMIALAVEQGFTVSEIPVPLYPRHSGKSKFGLSRIPIGVLDMLAVWFEMRFGQKPLLAFGMLGAVLFTIGVITGIIAVGIRIFGGVGFRPLLNLIETCLVLGSVFFATGLLGEQIAQQRAELRDMRRSVDEIQAENDEDGRNITGS